MVNKRQSSTKREGKLVIRRNNIGSGYKKKSIVVNIEESFDGLGGEEIADRINTSHNPETLIAPIEKDIYKWLEQESLLVDGKYEPRTGHITEWDSDKLERDMESSGFDDPQEYFKHIGTCQGYSNTSTVEYHFKVGELQAHSCLKLINEIKARVKTKKDHFYSLCSALELARVYKLWFFSINEGVLSKKQSPIANIKITPEIEGFAFDYFETLKSEESKKQYPKKDGAVWDIVAEKVNEEFGLNSDKEKIASNSLYRKYKTRNN
jgi:hypothetical protein